MKLHHYFHTHIQMNEPTVTVAIPAYNEEANIRSIILSILTQKQTNYQLSQIIVLNDESTDNTTAIVNELNKKYPIVRQIMRKIRLGKAAALNDIYDANTSDYLMTVDADCALGTDSTISSLVAKLESNPRLNAVGPRHVPIKPDTFMGRLAWISYLSFEDAFLHYNDGYNFYTSMSGQLLRRSFVDSFRFPPGTLSDQIYVYAKATEHDERAFELVRDAILLFTTVTTFRDWRILAVRSTAGDKTDATNRFGNDILNRYQIPPQILITSLVRWFIKHPILLTGSIIMNIYIRIFPLKREIVKDGIWIPTSSSKQNIVVRNS